MKIILFGSNGMLGNYLNSYLSDKHDVLGLTRKDIDLANVSEDELMFFLEQNFFDYSNSKDAWYWIVIGKLFVAWLSLAPLLFSFKLFYNKFTIFIQIKKMEKAYDKQGGFLWSNQQY